MISFENAIKTVLENSRPTGQHESIALWDSLLRILAVDVKSDINMPPFDKSAVDGYACRRADLEKILKIIEVVPAGQFPKKTVEPGCCVKIMTGAPVPPGTECIIMVEETEEVTEGRIKFIGKETKNNFTLFAEDVKEGDVVLSKGTIIEPQHIAIIAAVGVSSVEVAIQPMVSILITGDELVETNVKPERSQIRNSNGHQLVAQVKRAGGIPVYGGIVEDTKEATHQAISNTLDKSDIVVLTGGVSMGDFDYVPGVLKELGVDIKFQTIAVQPGKPTVFGVKGSKLVFGLPGNPVSSLFQFEMLVRPAILALMGAKKPVKDVIKMPIAADYTRKRTDRLALVPAKLNSIGEVEPINYHGSAHIFALSVANAVIIVPIGIERISKGDHVDVRPI